MTNSLLQVVAAAIKDPCEPSRVLIAQRPAGKWQAGRWEFPGGKVEAEETEAGALMRELEEELGIHVQEATALGRFTHDYVDRSVAISLWLVTAFRGEPRGRDGQALRWVFVSELDDADLLEADAPMIPLLRDVLE